MSNTPKYWILLADESEDDRFFVKRILASRPEFAVCHESGSGEDLISYLQGKNKFANRTEYPFPHAILLDPKLKGPSDGDILRWLKGSSFFEIPVIVISGSDYEQDRIQCEGLGARAFCQKPTIKDGHNLVDLILQCID